MATLECTTPAASDPVTVAELKAHARITSGSVEDTYLTTLITAATDVVQRLTRRQLINATYAFGLRQWPSGNGPIELPRPPLSSVSSVTYVDSDGTRQTMDAGDYAADDARQPGRVEPVYGEVWPSARDEANSILITYVAGYGAAGSSVPAALRQAILLMATHLYEFRDPVVIGGSVAEVPRTVDALVSPYRVSQLPTWPLDGK